MIINLRHRRNSHCCQECGGIFLNCYLCPLCVKEHSGKRFTEPEFTCRGQFGCTRAFLSMHKMTGPIDEKELKKNTIFCINTALFLISSSFFWPGAFLKFVGLR